MSFRLKPLDQQTIVITGASSGIGLVTARLAAERGANVVLVARGKEGLERAVEEIRAAGGTAISVVADVADEDALEAAAAAAVDEYGAIDTWINDAGVGMYGRLDEMHLDDKRRLFDVNFWGVVNGCRAALPRLREGGGAIVTVGSVVGDRAVPLLGIYSAAKHAVKAYIDTLRMELEKEDVPVSVSLVAPSSVDTPFFEHAKNYMDAAPKPLSPVYAPELVAETILECCERPIRDITVGGGGKAVGLLGRLTPRLADRWLEATAFDDQVYDDKGMSGTHNLFEPMPGSARGRYDGRVMRRSAYTTVALNPFASLLIAAGVAGAIVGGMRLLSRRGTRADQRLARERLDVEVGRDVEWEADLAALPDSSEAGAHVPAT